MPLSPKVLTASLLFIGGCVAPASNDAPTASGSTHPTFLNGDSAKPTTSPAYVTVALNGPSREEEIALWLTSNNVRFEKDPNGDVRIFDSPACRRVLVQYRRMLRVRLDLIAENMLHFNTTRDEHGEKNPYRRKYVVTGRDGSILIGTDQRPPLKHYEPGHPDADADGYVHYPNVDRAIEYVNAREASMAYELVTGILRRFDSTYMDDHSGDLAPGQPAEIHFSDPWVH